MNLDELAASLPNGLHDARLHKIIVDYGNHEARFIFDIWVGNMNAKIDSKREVYRKEEVILSGLLFLASEPPDSAYLLQQDGPLIVDVGAMHAISKPISIKIPPLPKGAFVNWIFVRNWNSFMYVAANDARLA